MHQGFASECFNVQEHSEHHPRRK